MQRYECPNPKCPGVFFRYIFIQCPLCGGKLRGVSNNKESRKVEANLSKGLRPERGAIDSIPKGLGKR